MGLFEQDLFQHGLQGARVDILTPLSKRSISWPQVGPNQATTHFCRATAIWRPKLSPVTTKSQAAIETIPSLIPFRDEVSMTFRPWAICWFLSASSGPPPRSTGVAKFEISLTS